jgi:hypothetical protein
MCPWQLITHATSFRRTRKRVNGPVPAAKVRGHCGPRASSLSFDGEKDMLESCHAAEMPGRLDVPQRTIVVPRAHMTRLRDVSHTLRILCGERN